MPMREIYAKFRRNFTQKSFAKFPQKRLAKFFLCDKLATIDWIERFYPVNGTPKQAMNKGNDYG